MHVGSSAFSSKSKLLDDAKLPLGYNPDKLRIQELLEEPLESSPFQERDR
jgi:hypothetical protein